MTELKDRVIEITDEDLRWDFRGSGEPYWKTTPRVDTYGSTHRVDPTPCYRHDYNLVLERAEMTEITFRVGIPPNWYLTPREEEGRTNGWASYDGFSNDEGVWDMEPYICLSAKRIPLHPAITRYLVAHEYGHVVDYWLSKCAGAKPGERPLLDDYAKLRGHETTTTYYGPGTWHLSTTELIANDFRILMCKAETEFWPHQGVPRPENFPKLKRWWREQWRKHAVEA